MMMAAWFAFTLQCSRYDKKHSQIPPTMAAPNTSPSNPKSSPRRMTRSQSTPIPIINIRRTDSEEALLYDQAIAEGHDARMYTRIVTGIMHGQGHNETKKQDQSLDYLNEKNACIQNINRTRFSDDKSLHSRHKKTLNSHHWVSTEEKSSPHPHDILTEATDGFLGPTIPRIQSEDHIFILDL